MHRYLYDISERILAPSKTAMHWPITSRGILSLWNIATTIMSILINKSKFRVDKKTTIVHSPSLFTLEFIGVNSFESIIEISATFEKIEQFYRPWLTLTVYTGGRKERDVIGRRVASVHSLGSVFTRWMHTVINALPGTGGNQLAHDPLWDL